jgi:hypothetical protein
LLLNGQSYYRRLAASSGHREDVRFAGASRLYHADRHYRDVKDKWIGFAGGLTE